MASKINIVITANGKQARAEFKETSSGLDTLTKSTDSSSRAAKALGVAADAAKVGLLATGAAAVAAGKFAVSSAADYEQSLNIFKSVSGATADQMIVVGARSRELGKDLTLPGVSAADAALAMVELAKAGLSVNDTMAASKGVLSLAKAGQMDTAQAAEIAANALNAFGLAGSEATRVADILAAAANASSADVTDLAYSLQMSSAQAAAVKVPIDNLVSSIGLMANNGIKGSDAGTSLKTMFMNLIPTTDRAKNSMRDLNLDFYDAKGNFVGMREMIRQLEEGTRKLTDEQKALHVENIFGSDSSRAANILIKEGVKGYDEMTKAVNRTGAATELAAAQNAGFKGALDGLKSTIETIAIDIGMKLLPGLTDAANAINANLEPSFERLKDVVKSVGPGVLSLAGQVGSYLIPKFANLWKAISSNLIPALKNVWSAVSPLVSAFGGALVGAIGLAIDALTLTVRVLSALTPVIVGGVAAWVAYRGVVLASNAIMMITSGLVYLMGTRMLVLNGSIIAVNGAVNAATIAQAAWNTVMSMNPIGLVVGAVAALTATIFVATRATDTQKSSTDRLNEARQRQADLAAAAKQKEDELRDASLGVEGANLRLEHATKAYNDAVDRYGSESLEARDAAYELKRANNELESATETLTKKQNDQLVVVGDLYKTLRDMNGKTFSYNINGQNVGGWTQDGKSFVGGNYSVGGYTGRGGKYDPAGIVHKGEFVLRKDEVDQSTGKPDPEKLASHLPATTRSMTPVVMAKQQPQINVIQNIYNGQDERAAWDEVAWRFATR